MITKRKAMRYLFRSSPVLFISINGILLFSLAQNNRKSGATYMDRSQNITGETHGSDKQKHAKPFHNRLISEKSPYLLQHAGNPVDWYPWGEEAFAKAREEDKPVFLSVGYSTCHWCHVMAHESFEDPQVAAMMNEAFISVKVDREERPDIDNLYMTVCQIMTGSGGWPLTIIMTPDKKPFYAATYIPREGRYGRIGLVDLIPRIQEIWKSRREEVLKSADDLTAALQAAVREKPGEGLGTSIMRKAYHQLSGNFDVYNGGFGHKPKFPTPHNLLFLLRCWQRFDEPGALQMVEKTLEAMRLGGIYDHVGFGFHRYSTDAEWLVPHFEKMLYDQALLAMAYTEAYQATKNEDYRKTAEEIFTYVLRDMRAPEGGFYSAEDADSEGEEGKFYLWTEEEIRDLLGEERAALVIRVFNVRKEGNFLEEASGRLVGRSILHMQKPLEEIAGQLGLSERRLQEELEEAREKLFQAREQRMHPHKDDKILTDWCGLMIAALARGAQVFDAPDYASAAEQAAGFILSKMRTKEGRLLHRYRDGEAAIQGMVDDYAFLIWGLLELYEATFKINHLKSAVSLNRQMLDRFWDQKSGGFYFTSAEGENLLVRQKDVYDGAIPSGNSAGMLNLLRLSRITGNADFEKKAGQIGRAFTHQISMGPSAYTQMMTAVDFATGPTYEVVIAGKSGSEDTKAMVQSLRALYVPNKVVLFRPTEKTSPEITRLAEFTRDQTGMNGQATAYVCIDYNCKQPTTDIDVMRRLLDPKTGAVEE